MSLLIVYIHKSAWKSMNTVKPVPDDERHRFREGGVPVRNAEASETDGPASTGLTETDGPASIRLSETDRPASIGLSETDGPASIGLSKTDGPASIGLSETDAPASTGLTETDGPASIGLTETDGPASIGLSETDGPASTGLTETDGPTSTIHGIDADIGNEFVREYYGTLYNAPEHMWRLYAEHAQYCAVHADGRRTVVTGRPQLRQFFRTSATADRDHGSRGQPIVESANTIRCGASGQLLVMATSDRFVQSFVVKFSAPWSFVVVASVVQYACVAQTAQQTAVGRSQQSSTDEEYQLFVGCLTAATTDKDIWRKFSEYGEVVSVRVMAGSHNRPGRRLANYAFVKFSGPEGVEAALDAGPITLYNGNRVRVNVKPYEGRT